LPVAQVTAGFPWLVECSDMPVYLSFLICALSGGTCHVTIPAERAFAGLSACQVEGMLMTPQWQEQHPGWTVKRIRCSIGRPSQDEETA
jgi:hypothetical protein